MDNVTVGCENGAVKNATKTNRTKEPTYVSTSPGEDDIAVGEYTIAGSAAGVNPEGEPSFVQIGAGQVFRTFSVSPGMSLATLRNAIRLEFEEAGFRASVVGDSVIILLPPDSARAFLDEDDALLETAVGVNLL